MLLARLPLDGPDRPQIVVFTSRASAGDAKGMAAWLDARVVDGAAEGDEEGDGDGGSGSRQTDHAAVAGAVMRKATAAAAAAAA